MSAPLRLVLASHVAARAAPTGAERSLALLAAGLARRGHQVTVLVPGRWVLGEKVREAGVQVVTVPSRPCWLTYWEPRPWPVVAWKALRCWLGQMAAGRLARAMAALAPQVVLVNCLPHLAAVKAAGRLGLPVLWHLREILPPGRRRRWWGRQLLGSGAACVAVSQAVQAWVVEEVPGLSVAVVYNGVEIPPAVPEPARARRALGLPEAGVWVGFLGQLAPHKGVELFLDAAAVAGGELRFLLAGPGTPQQQRQVRRRAAAVPGGCVVLPPRPDVGELLAACDVVAIPTLTPDPAPRVVIEAMAAGRVVVGAATGGIPELMQDGITGVLLRETSPAALVGALERLAADAAARARLSAAARAQAAERFSLERHVDEMEALLRRRAAGEGSPLP